MKAADGVQQLLSDLGTNNLFSHLALSYNLHTLLTPASIYNRHTPQKFSADIFEAYIGALWLRARQSPRDKWQQEKTVLRWINKLYGQPVWPVVDDWTEQTRQVLLANTGGVKVEPMTPRPRVHSGMGTKGNPWVVDTPLGFQTPWRPPTPPYQPSATFSSESTPASIALEEDHEGFMVIDTWRPPTPPGPPPPTDARRRVLNLSSHSQIPSRALSRPVPVYHALDGSSADFEKDEADEDDNNDWVDMDLIDIDDGSVITTFPRESQDVPPAAARGFSASPLNGPLIESLRRKAPHEDDLRQTLFARKFAKTAQTDRPSLASRIGINGSKSSSHPRGNGDADDAERLGSGHPFTPLKPFGMRIGFTAQEAPRPPIPRAFFSPVKTKIPRTPRSVNKSPLVRSKTAAVLSAVKRVKKLVTVVRRTASNVKMATPGKGSPRGASALARRIGKVGVQERSIGSPIRFGRGTPLKYYRLG